MGEKTLQTVDRALQILELLGKQAMTATEIKNTMDLNKTTVHRLMMTLLDKGFVERNDQTGIYQIGIKLVEMSSVRLNQIELKTEAYPYLQQLSEQVNQSVQLAILDGDEAVFIEKIEKYQSFHMYCQTGKRIPLYCSAVGKALLLDKDNKEILQVLEGQEFIKFTDNTLMDPMQVLDCIQKSRHLGYTKDNAEHEPDVYCVAAPIFDYRGKVIAAASITGFDPKVFQQPGKVARQAVMDTCMTISKRLGFAGSQR